MSPISSIGRLKWTRKAKRKNVKGSSHASTYCGGAKKKKLKEKGKTKRAKTNIIPDLHRRGETGQKSIQKKEQTHSDNQLM